MAYASRQEPSAPPMYPSVSSRPVPPPRIEYSQDPQQQSLLQSPPTVPPRYDQPEVRSRRNDIEENLENENNDCACNYNRYATRKTLGHFFFVAALLLSNAVQLRTLILQKHHDGIWIASLILVCVSILSQLGLAALLYIIYKGDIRNPQKQSKLERLNNFAFAVVVFISLVNISINVFMLTINPKSFLDTRSLDILQQNTSQ